jgi:hypothetical protein
MTNVTLAPYEQVMAKKIDEYFRQELIFKRNRRMGQRVLELLAAHPDKSFFFAFGAGKNICDINLKINNSLYFKNVFEQDIF